MSEFISLEDAVQMTTTYRDNMNEILKTEYQDPNVLAICETFDKSHIEDLLHQEGCEKLRIYFGMGEDYFVHPVIVGVDDHDQDILIEGDEMILERGLRCPDDCPPSSALNS